MGEPCWPHSHLMFWLLGDLLSAPVDSSGDDVQDASPILSILFKAVLQTWNYLLLEILNTTPPPPPQVVLQGLPCVTLNLQHGTRVWADCSSVATMKGCSNTPLNCVLHPPKHSSGEAEKRRISFISTRSFEVTAKRCLPMSLAADGSGQLPAHNPLLLR